MKIPYTILATCLCLSANSQQAFKAITYNIKWNDIMVDVDSWDDRKDAMVVFFEDEDADFLGLQEVLEDQLFFLCDNMPAYKSMGVGRDDGKKKGEFSPILYNTERWESLESKTIWLSETPEEVSRGWDAACNRVVTYGLFQNLISKDTIAVFNTHFDHQGKEARSNSVELLVDFVREKSRGLPTIVIGDFNLNPRDNLYATLVDDLHDVHEEAFSVNEENDGTFNGFRLKGDYKERIDYVFYTGPVSPISYDSFELRTNGRHVSDHFPVVAVLQFLADE